MPPLERVLLPIVVTNVPGAMASTWTSYASVYDGVETANTIIVPRVSCNAPDAGDELPTCDLPGGPTKPPRVVPLGFFPTRPGDTGGAFVHVERAHIDRVFLSLHLQQGNTVPLQLPVVRERDFRDDIELISVPDRSGSRVMLRVYGSDPERTGAVRVRVYTANFPASETLLHETTLDLHVVQRYYAQGIGPSALRLPTRPPYAQLYFGAPLTAADDTLRFEIVPLDADTRIWAFVSITDNTTQHVTLRTP